MRLTLWRCAALAAILVFAAAAHAGNFASGPMLVGTGAAGAALQGYSVAVSSDGNTAIVGGYGDSFNTGAAWVFARSGGVWKQQGGKLVGAGAVGAARQGFSVALSADGSTAIVGGYSDSSFAGAAWVFVKSGEIWVQQDKLVGTGAVGALQGWSVALSSDGNTAIVGGPYDSSEVGAAWIFSRSGGIWTQQGGKLVGTGAVGGVQGGPKQGWSVALSSDGSTAIVGGRFDSGYVGAAWVFTRSGGVWTQQGDKLVGTGSVGGASQGSSVALSSDGATAIVGGPSADFAAGATWIFTRSVGVWTQQGDKLVGTGAVGAAQQGTSVALSSDGSTAIVGGWLDSSNTGATWVFTRSGGVWTQQGDKLVGTGAVGRALQGWSVALSSDGNTAIAGGYADSSNAGAAWVFTRLCQHGDMNGDGALDVVDVFYLINYLFAGGPPPQCS